MASASANARTVIVVAGLLSTCAPPLPIQTNRADGVDLTVTADAPLGGETLTCHGFDASALVGHSIAGIHWTLSTGAVATHHAAVYAVRQTQPTGPFACDAIPSGAVGLHIWAPGNDGIALPDGTGLSLPDDTRSLLIQVHAIRTAAGDAATITAHIDFRASPPARIAAFTSVVADVPSIAPHATARAGSQCPIGSVAHTLVVWPHMHLAGREFHAAIVHADGTRDALVDVAPWDFNTQRFYDAPRDLVPGDVIESECIWTNSSGTTVNAGAYTRDEMCTLGVLVWPASAAHWDACR